MKLTRIAIGAVLVIVAVVWLRIDGPYEGRVLLVFDKEHGVTLADLPSIAMLILAAAVVWPIWRR